MCHILVIHNSFTNNSGIQLRSTMWSKLITRVPINNKRVRMRSNLKRHHKYISVQFMCSGGGKLFDPPLNLLVCSHPKKWTVSRQNIIQNSRENTLYKSYKLICASLSEIRIWSPTTQSEFWHRWALVFGGRHILRISYRTPSQQSSMEVKTLCWRYRINWGASVT